MPEKYELDTFDKEVVKSLEEELLKTEQEIKKVEDTILKPLQLKGKQYRDQLTRKLFQPIIARILSGATVGKRSHWCSPFYEFNYKEWKALGYSSVEEWIMIDKQLDWVTFDVDEITLFTDPEHFMFGRN